MSGLAWRTRLPRAGRAVGVLALAGCLLGPSGVTVMKSVDPLMDQAACPTAKTSTCCCPEMCRVMPGAPMACCEEAPVPEETSGPVWRAAGCGTETVMAAPELMKGRVVPACVMADPAFEGACILLDFGSVPQATLPVFSPPPEG